MKRVFAFTALLGICFCSYSQVDSIVHRGTFKKGKMIMSSNPYKPDSWEKPYFDSSLKSVYPSDIINHPERYQGKLIHLIGIVDSVWIDSNRNATFRLENKFWDYIEDYSIQDEKMFVSEKGEGKFFVTLSKVSPEQYEELKNFPNASKLFLVYGNFEKLNSGFPFLIARQIKYIDYEFYTTKVFSYEILRDANGEVVTDKKGRVQLKNFKFLRIAKPGQNK